MAFSDYFHRRSIRLRSYDYSQNGLYFVTICTREKYPYFGVIQNSEMNLSNVGERVRVIWENLPKHFPNVCLHAFIIMPNHFHGIIQFRDFVGASFMTPRAIVTSEKDRKELIQISKSSLHMRLLSVGASFMTPDMRIVTLGHVIRYFKAKCTYETKKTDVGQLYWQRGFYEHIIRNERSYFAIQQYIQDNPKNWEKDEDFTSPS